MHRIRLAMQQGTVEKLSGEIESDETFVGGKAKNMHRAKRAAKITGRGAMGKAVVHGLIRRNAEGAPSRVQVTVVKDNRKKTIQPQIRARVAPGSELCTDALKSYDGLDEGYVHQVIDHAVRYAEGKVHTNSMENFWCLLDRSIDGTYVSVDPDHLPKYIDAQAFRFNERTLSAPGRFLLVIRGVAGRRLTWDELTERPEGTKPRRGGSRKCYRSGHVG